MQGHVVGHIGVEVSRRIEYHCSGLIIRVLVFLCGSFLLAHEINAKLLVIKSDVIVLAIRRASAMLFELEESSGVNPRFAGHVFAKNSL